MIILMYIVKEWLKVIGCMLSLLSSMLVYFVFFHGVDEHLVGRHLFFLSFNAIVVLPWDPLLECLTPRGVGRRWDV
jgi:hypothetical protein